MNTGIKYFPRIINKLQNQVWHAFETAEERERGGKGNTSTYFHHVDVEEIATSAKKVKENLCELMK